VFELPAHARAPKPPVDQLGEEQLMELLYYMKLNRALEEKLANLYRQNKVVGGLYRSLGQEACSVGAAYALERGDIFTPLIRNLGAILVRGGRPRDVLCQYMARRDGPTRGRDLNTHFGWLSQDGSNIAVISMLGEMVAILAGAVLAERLQGRRTVALTWIGDGGTSTGAFHEGLNLACVLRAPLVVIVENNKWAYSTPTRRQTANPRFVDRAHAYGCAGDLVDGNDVLSVYAAARGAIERARAGEGPTLIEADTMRMRGHAEHDDMKYVPADQLAQWAAKDPIRRFEQHLVDNAIADAAELAALDAHVESELAEELKAAESSPLPAADEGLSGVYGDRETAPPTPPLVAQRRARRGA
jgi:pyruvate dehydrogenase E1 component alpha subunit/2-oxoisovalerate dehydrogenase E1 component alpha subunit